MPTGAVEYERDVFAFSYRRGERVEKRLHANDIRIGQDQREGVVGAGLDGGVDISIRVALIGEARRPLTALPPDVADAPLLSDAGLVLKIQAQALGFVRMLNSLQDFPGSF